ncbi:phosphoribosylformylglycinamidine synthase I [Haloarcula litorea]|uniref:phosphoribosylformylglycinamidine synthase I n=1 Tax=Haloarcula litorea TaxID=3032579 RepID=UPI0023E77D45|nr:phosphoribosylformylglycinamidine synthase I [Halomicroarcula sp. GDY20]
MIAVVQFGGSNCDRDSVQALTSLGFDAELVWHEDGLPADVDGVMLPGGFSYGDYLRAGAMAARSPIVEEVRDAAADGTPVLGVCNGAQIGCESSLTPGAFTTNESARFQCEHVHCRVENADTPWTSGYDEGEVVELPIAHGEGRYEIADDRLDELERDDRILFKYCDAEGEVTPEANPNGSKHAVAGVTGDDDHVAVMMPHPERASLDDLGRTDGERVLDGFGH